MSDDSCNARTVFFVQPNEKSSFGMTFSFSPGETMMFSYREYAKEFRRNFSFADSPGVFYIDSGLPSPAEAGFAKAGSHN